MSKSPVVDTAKNKVQNERERILSTGIAVLITPVSASLLMEVQNRIPYPPVPVVVDEDKGQTYENPNHPDYIRKVEHVDNLRSVAAMDAITMFGVELVDGLPDDDKWLRKLQTMDRAGNIGLKDYDLDDEIDQEFLYKKFIAVSTDDFSVINSLIGVTEEGVKAAEDSFQGDA